MATGIKVIENGKVKYSLTVDGDTKVISSVRTPREIDEEAANLKALRENVQEFNNIGDSNHDIIQAEIDLLNSGYIETRTATLGWVMSAQNLVDWLTDRNEGAPSSYWQCIVGLNA